MSNKEDTLDPLDFYDKNIEFNIHDAMTKLENIVTEYVD